MSEVGSRGSSLAGRETRTEGLPGTSGGHRPKAERAGSTAPFLYSEEGTG